MRTRRHISSLVALITTICMIFPTTVYATEQEEGKTDDIIAEQNASNPGGDAEVEISKTLESDNRLEQILEEKNSEGNQEEEASNGMDTSEQSVVLDYKQPGSI